MAATPRGSKRLLRDLNRSIVLNLIAARGPLSRTELAGRGGLPTATVTRIVGDFIAAGLVSEVASDESTGGRRPVLLSINPAAHVVGGARARPAPQNEGGAVRDVPAGVTTMSTMQRKRCASL